MDYDEMLRASIMEFTGAKEPPKDTLETTVLLLQDQIKIVKKYNQAYDYIVLQAKEMEPHLPELLGTDKKYTETDMIGSFNKGMAVASESFEKVIETLEKDLKKLKEMIMILSTGSETIN